MKSNYQPDRGDLIYLEFTPQSGTEQAGRRPALVLSPAKFNIATGLAFVCPITNQLKGSPFEVQIPKGCRITGAVLSDHLRSLDWISRRAEFNSAAPADLVVQVLERIHAILEPAEPSLFSSIRAKHVLATPMDIATVRKNLKEY